MNSGAPDTPEPEFNREERRAERVRLRAVRRERRNAWMKSANGRKNRAKGKQGKKDKKK